MDFFKEKWGYILVLALVLIGAGIAGYFWFGRNSGDYTGGMLVHMADTAKEMM